MSRFAKTTIVLSIIVMLLSACNGADVLDAQSTATPSPTTAPPTQNTDCNAAANRNADRDAHRHAHRIHGELRRGLQSDPAGGLGIDGSLL